MTTDNQQNTDIVALALEGIRYLSQVAEACSLYSLEQGHDGELTLFAVHCSDRAEHIAQDFISMPVEKWPLDSLHDDVSWLMAADHLLAKLRLKVQRNIPTRADLAALSSHIGAVAAIAEIAQPSVNLATKQGLRGLRGSPLFGVPPVIYDELHMARPSSPAEQAKSSYAWAFALHGRDFASLGVLDLQRFRLLRDQGRKFGITASVDVVHDSAKIQNDLASASRQQQEEIYRQLETRISVLLTT